MTVGGKAPGIFCGLDVPAIAWLGLCVAFTVVGELVKLTCFWTRVADGESDS